MAQAPKPEEPDIAEVLAELDNPAEIQAPQFVNQPALAFENNITHAPSSIHQTQPVSYLLKKVVSCTLSRPSNVAFTIFNCLWPFTKIATLPRVPWEAFLRAVHTIFQAYYQQYTKNSITDIRSLAKKCTLTAKLFGQTNKITAKDLRKARHRLPLGP